MDFQKYDDIFNKDNYPMFQKTFLPVSEKVCICLSGKQYSNCCKNDVDEAFKNRKYLNESVEEELQQRYFKKDKKLLSHIVENKSINKKNIAYCSAHKVFGDCSNNMTRSHTLSRGNILKNLSFSKNVIRFNDHKIPEHSALLQEILDYYTEVSIDDASATVSFCKKHDEELFADIEKHGYTDYSGSDIQNVEYSLKAISFDIYYKVMNIRYMAQLIEESKFVVCHPDGSISDYFRNYNYLVDTLFRLYPLMLKLLMELKQLKAQTIAIPELKTVYFELPARIINFSLSEIFDIDDTICYINVINSKKPFIIVSYYKEYGRIEEIDKLKKQFESYIKTNMNNQLMCLWHFIKHELLINAQNIYFNKSAFYRLSNEAQIYLFCVHREGLTHIPSDVQQKYDSEIQRILYVLYDI